jgi:ProP effector
MNIMAKGTKERAGDIIEVLADLWPGAFAVEPRLRQPLKVSINADVLAAASGAITSAELIVALNSYVRAKAYLRALRVGTPRIGLDGIAAGVVTAQEAAHAEWLLERAIAKESARVRARAFAAQRALATERGDVRGKVNRINAQRPLGGPD